MGYLFNLIRIIAPASKVHPAAGEQLEQDVPGKGKNNNPRELKNIIMDYKHCRKKYELVMTSFFYINS